MNHLTTPKAQLDLKKLCVLKSLNDFLAKAKASGHVLYLVRRGHGGEHGGSEITPTKK